MWSNFYSPIATSESKCVPVCGRHHDRKVCGDSLFHHHPRNTKEHGSVMLLALGLYLQGASRALEKPLLHWKHSHAAACELAFAHK